MKNVKAKRNLTKVLCVLLSICLLMSLGLILMSTPVTSYADIVDKEFSKPISVSQSQFDTNTTSAPISPTGWTGEYLGSSGSVTSGIIGFNSTFEDNYNKLDLDRYDEFSKNVIPDTPFGTSASNVYPGTNKNVLMINNLYPAAYGYSSESISLDANSYYKFSVWVRTGKFGSNQGAAVSLTGLDQPVGIWNIDTPFFTNNAALTKENKYGFVEYVIYLGTGSNSETVNLKLSNGDYAEEYSVHNYKSMGYAFFANVNVTKMSPTVYNRFVSPILSNTPDNILIHDANPSSPLFAHGNPLDIGSFKNLMGGMASGWTKIDKNEDEDDESWIDDIVWGVYDGGDEHLKNNMYGLTSDPYTPGGKFDPIHKTDKQNNIMVLSSYKNEDNYKSVSGGIKSDDIIIENSKYYRLSAWYNTQQGANAAFAISGESTSYANEYKLGPFTNSDLTSDNNTDRYGWQRTGFYIKGPAFEPSVKVNVELWMGKTAKTSGVVMFDDITLEEISIKDFNANEFGYTVVNIDTNNSPSAVTNGDFVDVDFDTENENIYPLAPSNWTYITSETSGTIGQSPNKVNTDKVVSGVAPTHQGHFEANKDNYNKYSGMYITNPNPHGTAFENVNVLLMASPANTVFGYRSSEIQLSGGTDYQLRVSLLTDLKGYGASLVLKNGDSIVSSVEGIHTPTTTEFKDYSFYISGAAGTTNLTLEIWFGMTDMYDNYSKISKGHMFVNSVNLDTLAADDSGATILASKLEEYNSSPADLDYAVYRLGAFDFNAYDRYNTNALKPLYDMTFTSSDSNLAKAGVITKTSESLGDFYDAHMATQNRFNNVIMLQNTASTYSRYQANSTLNLAAGNYYKIDFSVLVKLGEDDRQSKNAVGAGIWLGDKGMENIRDTYKYPYPIGEGGKSEYIHEFQTYSFYYAVGDEDRNVNWAITLGANDKTNKVMEGTVLLNYILVTQIEGDVYKDEIAELEEKDNKYFLAVDMTNVTDGEDDGEDTGSGGGSGGSSFDWLIIPSIIFAVAILVAIGAVVVKRYLARRPNKYREKVVSYDRKDTLNVAGTKSYEDGDESREVFIVSGEATYDEFDDENGFEPTPTKSSPKAKQPRPAVVQDPAPEAESVEETPVPEAEVEEKAVEPINEFDD